VKKSQALHIAIFCGRIICGVRTRMSDTLDPESIRAQGFNGTHAGGSKSRENAGGQGNKAENESHGCQGDRIALADSEKERSKKSGQTQRAGDLS
jgi:hypothetical protein